MERVRFDIAEVFCIESPGREYAEYTSMPPIVKSGEFYRASEVDAEFAKMKSEYSDLLKKYAERVNEAINLDTDVRRLVMAAKVARSYGMDTISYKKLGEAIAVVERHWEEVDGGKDNI